MYFLLSLYTSRNDIVTIVVLTGYVRSNLGGFDSGEPDPFGPDNRLFYGMRKDQTTSPWKLNLVAKQIRGMMVDDAMAQLE